MSNSIEKGSVSVWMIMILMTLFSVLAWMIHSTSDWMAVHQFQFYRLRIESGLYEQCEPSIMRYNICAWPLKAPNRLHWVDQLTGGHGVHIKMSETAPLYLPDVFVTHLEQRTEHSLKESMDEHIEGMFNRNGWPIEQKRNAQLIIPALYSLIKVADQTPGEPFLSLLQASKRVDIRIRITQFERLWDEHMEATSIVLDDQNMKRAIIYACAWSMDPYALIKEMQQVITKTCMCDLRLMMTTWRVDEREKTSY